VIDSDSRSICNGDGKARESGAQGLLTCAHTRTVLHKYTQSIPSFTPSRTTYTTQREMHIFINKRYCMPGKGSGLSAFESFFIIYSMLSQINEEFVRPCSAIDAHRIPHV
jgi:hypothetical protein